MMREVAISELQAIELALRDADDLEASEIVQRAVKELQATLIAKEPRQNRVQATRSRLMEAAASAGASVHSASTTAATAIRAGASRVAQGAPAVKAASGKANALVRSGASGAAAGFAVAHEALAGYAQSLEWSMIPAGYVAKFVTAGTRGIPRSLEEARLVWETIPEPLRALGPEEVAKRLNGFDWSHRIPYSKGGSNDASNGIFELAGLNRSRGAQDMTAAQLQAAQDVLAETAFTAVLEEAASQLLSGGMVAAAVSCVVSSLELGLQYQRGEITKDEMYQGLGRAVAKSAGVGAAISGLMVVVALAFPALIPLAAPVMAPLAVLGFCAVGGKVVRLGKGWYEVYQDVSARLPAPTATQLLTAQTSTSA
ncbi:MAG: hypothetical protein F4Z84_07490 [Gammaproteobacteria bacterium]|nr:hypothetical protein [Gammaproteobacteria bacterium]